MPTISEPYIPIALHYEEADFLEYVSKDVPTFTRLTEHNAIEILFDVETKLPIGWRIYGWSKINVAV